jgi:hypothetical protein
LQAQNGKFHAVFEKASQGRAYFIDKNPFCGIIKAEMRKYGVFIGISAPYSNIAYLCYNILKEEQGERHDGNAETAAG